MRVLLSDRVPPDIVGLLGCESCHEWLMTAKVWANPVLAGATRDSQCTYRMMMVDLGRPYALTTAAQLLEDFWREVKRDLDERGITHDL